MLCFFLQPQMLAVDANNGSVDRSLEAYLLWLFGCIMFNNSHGDSVDRILMPYAWEIANATDDDVPTWSWGSFAPMGPPPQMGSHAAAEAGPSHVGTPFPTGTSSVIA